MTRCDFCGSQEPVCAYPAADFSASLLALSEQYEPLDRAEWRSRGPWLACEDCRALIDADDQPGLTDRATRIYAGRGGLSEQQLRVGLTMLHDAFWRYREGPARALD